MTSKTNLKIKFLILILILIIAFICSIFLGRFKLTPGEVFELIRLKISGMDLPPSEGKVLFEIRLPRLIASMIVGAALSLSGSAYQGMFKNPMASPDILGASTGACFGAALGIFLGFNYFGITLLSFTMGIAAVLLAYFISRLTKGEAVLSMILAGMIIAALFQAGTSYIKMVADTENQLPAITFWLMGSLSSIKSSDLIKLIIPSAIGMIPLILLRWKINLLTINEDEARSMGVNTGLLRVIVIICATLLTSVSVSISGLIGWVGLVIPHFCRLLFGSDNRKLIPASALLGAAFLLIVDDVARIAASSEIPLGILTSFIGAPLFFILLLRRGNTYGSRS